MPAGPEKVLVVEDEAPIRKFIAVNLHRHHFTVLEAADGETALEMARKFTPAVVVLDLMLPGMDGFAVCLEIRKLIPHSVIIMLTARGEDLDKIMGLELGADDYMIKPFNPLELIARIHAHLRKVSGRFRPADNRLSFHHFTLDPEGQRFYKDGNEVELTPTEFAIMKLFFSHPQKAFSRREILNRVWGDDYFGDLKTVDVHVRRIREKLEEDPSAPRWIETVWGVGYRLGKGKNHED